MGSAPSSNGMFGGTVARDRALLCVYGVIAVDTAASALNTPVMPFLVESLPSAPLITLGKATRLGAVYSTFALAQMVSSTWMGPASHVLGRRMVFLVSLSALCAGMAVSALAPDYSTFLASRAWLGLFAGTMATANAYIAEVALPAERANLMAWVGTVAQLAFVVCPAIGGFVSGLAAAGGMRAPFFIGAAGALLIMIWACCLIRDVVELQSGPRSAPGGTYASSASPSAPLAPRARHGSRSEGRAAGSHAARKPRGARSAADTERDPTQWGAVLLICAAQLFVSASGAALMVCVALDLEKVFGYGAREFGLLVSAAAAWTVGLRIKLYGATQRALGLMPTATYGALVGGVAFYGYTLATDDSLASLAIFCAAQLMAVAGSMFTGACIAPFLGGLATQRSAGRVMTINNLMSSAGRVVGPPLFGHLYDASGREAALPFYVAAGLMLGAGVFCFVAGAAHKNREAARATELA